MTEDDLDFSARLASLRSAFDRTFAEPPTLGRGVRLHLLAIRVGAHPFVVRLDHVSGIERSRRLVHLPGAVGALLGLTGVRGALVPVFSLARIVGEDAPATEPWTILCAGRDPIGLAVSRIEGYREVSPGAIAARAVPSRYVGEQVRLPEMETGLIDLKRVVDGVMRVGEVDPRRSAKR
jgi:chemotaxis signal transduction protein